MYIVVLAYVCLILSFVAGQSHLFPVGGGNTNSPELLLLKILSTEYSLITKFTQLLSILGESPLYIIMSS